MASTNNDSRSPAEGSNEPAPMALDALPASGVHAQPAQRAIAPGDVERQPPVAAAKADPAAAKVPDVRPAAQQSPRPDLEEPGAAVVSQPVQGRLQPEQAGLGGESDDSGLDGAAAGADSEAHPDQDDESAAPAVEALDPAVVSEDFSMCFILFIYLFV